MRRRELLGALAAAGVAACAGRPVAARPRGPELWLARRGSARIFVLGFAEAKSRSWWSAAVDRAFADSSELWLETPPQPAPDSDEARARKAVIDQLGYQRGRTFYDALAPEVRVRAQAYVADLGIDPAEIEPMRPWLAYYAINGAFWRKYKPVSDLEYPDAVFRERAARAGKALRYEFATSEAALQWFAAMPDAAQNQYIAMLLDFLDDQKRGANEAFLGWVRGEPSTRAIDHMRSALPALYEVIQRRRNAWWAHRIDELLAGGTHLIVIGMNHMLGPDGIPRQLAAAQLAVNEVGA
jgi:uncharacterized protein YbaP (TraB family)